MAFTQRLIKYKKTFVSVLINSDCESIFDSLILRASKKGKKFYIQGYFKGTSSKNILLLHRLFTNANKNENIDHINGDTLDNRLCNLRKCNQSENRCNSIKPLHGVTSKFKGVGWVKKDKVWRVRVYKNKKSVYTGYFKNELDAAKSYDYHSKIHHGSFSLNNIKQIEKETKWKS